MDFTTCCSGALSWSCWQYCMTYPVFVARRSTKFNFTHGTAFWSKHTGLRAVYFSSGGGNGSWRFRSCTVSLRCNERSLSLPRIRILVEPSIVTTFSQVSHMRYGDRFVVHFPISRINHQALQTTRQLPNQTLTPTPLLHNLAILPPYKHTLNLDPTISPHSLTRNPLHAPHRHLRRPL